VDAEGVVVSEGDLVELPLLEAPNSVVPRPGLQISDAAVRNALAVHTELPSILRAMVLRYDAPSDRGLRLLLAVDAVDPGDTTEPAAPDDADVGADAGEAGQVEVEGVWVRFGRAERVSAKAEVILLLLDQARQQAQERRALGQDGDDLGVAELDVRTPDNPVLVPRS
jgi:hypothetical protein